MPRAPLRLSHPSSVAGEPIVLVMFGSEAMHPKSRPISLRGRLRRFPIGGGSRALEPGEGC